MTKIRSINVSFGADVYRIVTISVLLLSQFYIFRNIFNALAIVVIMLPWGCLLLLCDVLHKRRLLQTKQLCILFAIMSLFVISTVLTGYFTDNIYKLLFMAVSFFVLCVPDEPVSMQKKYKIILVFFAVTIIPTTILSVMSIWAQAAQFGVYIDGLWYGYAIHNPRLGGFFGSEWLAGMLSFFSIAMLAICRVMLPKVVCNKRMITAANITIPIMILSNFITLTLSDFRGFKYATIIFALLFSFFALLRYFSVRLSSAVKSFVTAALLAGIIAGAVFLADRPVRVGVAVLQSALSKEAGHTVINADTAGGPAVLARGTQELSEPMQVRYQLWRFGFELIKQHPVLGVTPDEFPKKAIEVVRSVPGEEIMTHSFILDISDDETADKERGISEILTEYELILKWGGGLHNAYIQFAATYGVPAFVLLLLFLILFAVRNIKTIITAPAGEHSLAAGGILALCAGIAFYNIFESHINHFERYPTVLFWSCLSYCATLMQDTDRSQKEKIERYIYKLTAAGKSNTKG